MNNFLESLPGQFISAAVAISLVISAIAWPICFYQKAVAIEAIKAGLVETQNTGSGGTYWGKK
jgi:hypothetical protein